jgi:linoleoyl-CoA desaturase
MYDATLRTFETRNYMTGQSAHKPERVVFDGTGEFMKVLRARIHETLDGRASAGDPPLLRKAALIAIWFVGSFVLLLSVQSLWLQVLFCFSYGLAASAVGFNIFHDANHGAISPSRRVNLVVGATASAVLGASRYLWNYKHNVLHHRLTNIHTWDDDLETRGFLRLTPRQHWKPRYYGQHLFVFVLYAINAIELIFVKDFVQYFTLRINPHQSIPAMSTAEKVEFWAAKAFYLGVFVALPFAILPTARVLEGFVVYQLTLGLSLGLVFSMAHQVESVDFPSPRGAPPTINEDWGTHQMRTTANFATLNHFWNWFSGGLNHQIEHHLFPSMSHTHYVAIGPVVRSTAYEFGLPYNHFETYGAALHSHYRLLRKLGKRTLPASGG